MTYRYDFADTPFGDALCVFSDEGLVAFDLPEGMHRDSPWALEAIARMLHAVPEPDPGASAEIDELLHAYFSGEPIRFDRELTLDWRLANGFTRSALQSVCEIPWGESASYGEVAAMSGSPGAARAVGTACRNTPFSIVVPVHRVVRADGSPGEYGAHPERKRYLLDLEADAAARARPVQHVRPGV
ncbi:MAG: methylated-DNA--[protein]-cysteine S-methyltransferase [Microbacterium sp.]|jgi:methylated-DNA-[protein]-cysteine S-methyltransferase|uniref:methylated-DNA--[protein]-cysteine S-methyltransferase n=1 Tax=Microbacterium sp. TaxID=51671 RepID=UPI0028312B16|nr:methylated-DNA--[protein]-cysteine S-methyltransferase [Microbacterium sp.]MDR2321600.1 methylated-DNA--[protein]-cysteine S-methyltransferase [Microbacterium sp.]